jgi:hypothetical protein
LIDALYPPRQDNDGPGSLRQGPKIRREVLGDAYVDRALAKSGPFNDP